MENDALLQGYSRKHEAQLTSETSLVQISSTSRQKITNNNRNSTKNSLQRSTANQFALRADSKEIILPGFRLIGNYHPQCNEDGTYSRVQCHGDMGYCWCVDENGNKTGENLTEY
ncbi:hypothetical protein AVEN_228857-1 [Araneus ventricosus]|uniref:Thyroglobulin type-1 domain-containing protein n=1 Tax=Araneus ventricosus TaxID=182803 RepID=A0A4Y2KYU6_ARAVE|nr:hypothetical protein AVEN_228857-1 [Araneus ventricosus]